LGPPYPGASGTLPSETSLQPSPEQQAIIAARRADPAGSLRVVAFVGSGKTTALRLLAEADTTPALYLAYNKSTQPAAQLSPSLTRDQQVVLAGCVLGKAGGPLGGCEARGEVVGREHGEGGFSSAGLCIGPEPFMREPWGRPPQAKE
jgi:hypothetical protein